MKKILLSLVVLTTIISSRAIHAASPFGPIYNPYAPGYQPAPDPDRGFGLFFGNLVTSATVIAGLGFLIYLIYGAFRYLTSAGDEKAIGEARKSIFHAFVGLVIIVLALAITAVVQAVLGLNILAPEFKGP